MSDAPAKKTTPSYSADGYHHVTPYIAVNDGNRAIDFYRHVFGAQVVSRFDSPGGGVAHAEILIGESRVMLSDPYPDMGIRAPEPGAGVTSSLMVYCPDVDAVHARALAAGATELKPLADEFHGDRAGTFLDPFGQRWMVATHIEDVSPEELERRVGDWMARQGPANTPS